MWLNKHKINDAAICSYRRTLLSSNPAHIVIDDMFESTKLDEVMNCLFDERCWQNQKHTYSALYVDNAEWQKAEKDERFVNRDVWQRNAHSINGPSPNIAQQFLSFLRSDEFMSLLSRIFKVELTDMNVAKPEINTNYFRLKPADFVNQHADDSPGREVCMLLYLNKEWDSTNGGELIFMGKDEQRISIPPLYNRCVLFDPFSEGSEHWVNAVNCMNNNMYRYNVTSWYWSK
jgi:Rps23 Pro-64 3,4-dihydroxylase Tpa1-like proline 4-hydroxylase